MMHMDKITVLCWIHIYLLINMVELQHGPKCANCCSMLRSSLECGLWGANIRLCARISHMSWLLAVVYFKADPPLLTHCTWLGSSYMIVSWMFAKGSFGFATVSTPSTGYGNINRVACVHIRGYGILLQNLVT